MIIVFGGIKGGSGKTTLATNFTVMRKTRGKNVLLIDADEQRSAYDWVCQREILNIETSWETIQLTGKYAHKDLQKIKDNYDDIIIDAGGRDTNTQRSFLSIADMFVVPFRPKSLDIWTLGLVKALFIESSNVNKRLSTVAVINQGDVFGSDNNVAFDILSECPEIHCLSTVINHRKAFSNASANGLSVIELRPGDKKAFQEIESLHDEIYK